MNRTMIPLGAMLVAALTLGVTVAIAGTVASGDDPGVTDTTIVLGGTAPLTGPASQYAAVARGADAYFKYVNARSGVNGRKIVYKVVDDGSSPVLSGPATRQLVEQEKVFAVFNSVGTAQNLAVRPYLNTMKVPQLFVWSGATTLGRDYEQYPYTIGLPPSYQAEGWVYGKFLARTAGKARVAVLFQGDDYGKDLLRGLKKGLQRSKAKVIAAEPYDAAAQDVAAQMTRLKASGADTLAIFATAEFAVQAYQLASKLGWKPKRVIAGTGAASSTTMEAASAGGQNKLVNGTISIQFVKDPADSAWKNDAAMKLYRKIMKQYAPGSDASDALYVAGMAAAWTVIDALRKAGKDLSRESLRKTLEAYTASGNPFMLPGIVVKTTGSDHFPVEQMILQRWQKGSWRSFGGLWGYRGT